MKMWKLPKITSDDVVAGNFIYADVSTLQDCTITNTTAVFTGLGWVLTFTIDGTDAAESRANAQLMVDHLLPLMLQYNGSDANRKESQKVYELWKGLDTPGISALTGIEKTGDLGNAIVTLALS